jgi:hypothetical protein
LNSPIPYLLIRDEVTSFVETFDIIPLIFLV